MPSPRRTWALSLAVAALLASCDGGRYTVVVRFDPESLAGEVTAVEVSLVSSCTDQVLGDPAVSPVETLALSRGSTSGHLGAVEPGTYGLYGRGTAATCDVVATGCTDVTLKAGGSGELVVVLSSAVGPGCPAGTTCTDGRCVGGDAGMEDATVSCPCADCACQPDGSCAPDHDMCAGDEYCDVRLGCVPAEPCAADDECTPVGDDCVLWSCDTDRGRCLPSVRDDGTDCTGAGRPGQCRLGECCAGCWDGAACVAGADLAACGTQGDLCAGCDDANACTADACVAGACSATADDTATCAGGTCHGGECCATCWDGAACVPATSGAACGADGAMCMTCDEMACPVEGCVDGGCGPIGVLDFSERSRSGCAITSDHGLFCWGYGVSGTLGLGDTMDRQAPVRVGTDTDWARLGLGAQHACAIKMDGTLWCWGRNQERQLGLGAGAPGAVLTPMQVGTDTDWDSVEGSYRHTCAIKTDHSLWCWGQNRDGRLGIPTAVTQEEPAQVGTDTDWAQVSSRDGHTCAVKMDGTLWCWGNNTRGQLGLGDMLLRLMPRQVGTDTDWAQVSAGGSITADSDGFTCAVKTDGTLWCWGYGGDGGLGLGDLMSQNSPMRVSIPAGVVFVYTGSHHACALRMSGQLFCWGDGSRNQLGQGDTMDRLVPTRVGTEAGWEQLTTDADGGFVLKAGRLIGWGADMNGDRGNGPAGDMPTPDSTCL